MVANGRSFQVGFDIPAKIGDRIDDIHTPALLIDLDAFERNVSRMADSAKAMGVRLRAHAKTHKSADIARSSMAERVAFVARKFQRPRQPERSDFRVGIATLAIFHLKSPDLHTHWATFKRWLTFSPCPRL